MLKVLPSPRAYSLAETHAPIAHCGFHRYLDWPTKIELNSNPMGEIFESMNGFPVCYYWARTDGRKYYYIGFALFHQADWAPFPANLLPGETHRFDLEGILVRAPYYTPHSKPIRGIDVLTVHHHELKSFRIADDYRPEVSIEYGGHGIESYDPKAMVDVCLEVRKWTLIPFDPIMSNPKRREEIRQAFNNNGVHLPDQWGANGAFVGWFWSKPDELFRVMGGK